MRALEEIRRAGSRVELFDAMKSAAMAFILFGAIGLTMGALSWSLGNALIYGAAGGFGGAALSFISDIWDIVVKHRGTGEQTHLVPPRRNMEDRIPEWMPSINPGWIRLGIVLTGAWLLAGASIWAWMEFDGHGVNVRESLAALFGLPIVSWVIAFLAVIAWNWIRSGFRPGDPLK